MQVTTEPLLDNLKISDVTATVSQKEKKGRK
jgi:hypothetical protein